VYVHAHTFAKKTARLLDLNTVSKPLFYFAFPSPQVQQFIILIPSPQVQQFIILPSHHFRCSNSFYFAFPPLQVQQFSEYVRAYMLARGDARLALDRHYASKAQAAEEERAAAAAAAAAAPGE